MNTTDRGTIRAAAISRGVSAFLTSHAASPPQIEKDDHAQNAAEDRSRPVRLPPDPGTPLTQKDRGMATFNSTVSCGTVNLNGTFDYTRRTLRRRRTEAWEARLLADGTVLTMTDTSTPGASVQFSITPTAGGQTYSFNGAWRPDRWEDGPCPSKKRDDDNWTASAQ